MIIISVKNLVELQIQTFQTWDKYELYINWILILPGKLPDKLPAATIKTLLLLVLIHAEVC